MQTKTNDSSAPGSARILLVDDDAVFRERMARALRRRHYHVTTASDTQEAVDAISCDQFDFGLFDLRMPGESGLALISPFLKHFPSAKVVVLTGFGSIASAMEAVRCGAADYLTKPVDADQIDLVLQGRPTSTGDVRPPSLARLEWEHIQRILHQTNHNISETARLLSMDRRTLQRKLSKNPPQN